MSSHIMDSKYFRNSWGTQEMRDIFEDDRKLSYWLEVEVALAQTQATLGIIPKEAAEEIEACAKIDLLDMEFYKKDLAATGHALVPLLRAVEQRCKNGFGEYVHFGATTQDILDTGSVLAMRDATKILIRDAARLEKALLGHAEKYIRLPMAGRTHHQQGLPITLGLKFANFAAELRRDLDRIKDMIKRCSIVMLHGGAGTLAGFGDKAYPTIEGVAKRLGLAVPLTCWANARDTIAEYLCVLGILAGTLARLANEIFSLSASEVYELHEPLSKQNVGSSTMPHKRNAAVCEMTVAQSRIVHANVVVGLNAMICEHERDARVWRLDLHNIPESSLLTGKMLDAMIKVVEGINVYEENITKNLDMLGGLLLSESVMFHLGQKLGKQTAHHLLHEITMPVKGDTRTFRQRLMDTPEIKAVITPKELEEILDYSKYLGESENEVRNTIAYCKKAAETDVQFM